MIQEIGWRSAARADRIIPTEFKSQVCGDNATTLFRLAIPELVVPAVSTPPPQVIDVICQGYYTKAIMDLLRHSQRFANVCHDLVVLLLNEMTNVARLKMMFRTPISISSMVSGVSGIGTIPNLVIKEPWLSLSKPNLEWRYVYYDHQSCGAALHWSA